MQQLNTVLLYLIMSLLWTTGSNRGTDVSKAFLMSLWIKVSAKCPKCKWTCTLYCMNIDIQLRELDLISSSALVSPLALWIWVPYSWCYCLKVNKRKNRNTLHGVLKRSAGAIQSMFTCFYGNVKQTGAPVPKVWDVDCQQARSTKPAQLCPFFVCLIYTFSDISDGGIFRYWRNTSVFRNQHWVSFRFLLGSRNCLF